MDTGRSTEGSRGVIDGRRGTLGSATQWTRLDPVPHWKVGEKSGPGEHTHLLDRGAWCRCPNALARPWRGIASHGATFHYALGGQIIGCLEYFFDPFPISFDGPVVFREQF